jgi:hypothetical protein
MPWNDDHQQQSDPFDRLLTLHKLMEACGPWAQLPPGNPRRLAYDKIAAKHERAINRIASDDC